MTTPKEALNKFKEVNLAFDTNTLPEDIRKALPHIKLAMDGITEIFLAQEDESLPKHYHEVLSGKDAERAAFYKLFKGPWCQLDDHKSCYPEYKDRPKGCAFYPLDMTKDELEKAFAALPEDKKTDANDNYTLIRKNSDGTIKIVPYHEYYKNELVKISQSLRNAAEIVKHDGLKHYLNSRAEGLLSGNYRDSDADWVRLTDSPIDLVIGPFEVYADAMLGIKATYESFLLAIDKEKTGHLKEIEKNIARLAEIFPVPGGAKAAVGGIAPMVVGHELYASGEACSGIMTSAFNLPNDPWVRGNVGWKQVMIYNVMQAKFKTCTSEIAKRISGGRIQGDFDPYFYFVLMHEVSHGLGPAYRADGTQVAKAIGTSYTAVEEAKADIGGIFILLELGGTCGIPKFDPAKLLDSFFAGLFRSMRFGVHEAHGAANVIEFNFLTEKGVVKMDAEGKYSTDAKNFASVIKELLEKLCLVEATATQAEAAEFVAKYGKPGKELLAAIDSLKDIPIDIRANYPI